MMRITVCGGGGMIGGHLVGELLKQGHAVRSVDIKPLDKWWQVHRTADNWDRWDLMQSANARSCLERTDWVYDLAENMGGIGFIEANRVECSESIIIGINLLQASVLRQVSRFFFSSSACVYNTHLQMRNNEAAFNGALQMIPGLKESDAWPAQPEDGYGFSKLYMEELCRHYQHERGLQTRVARYHNVFGTHGSWNDGREKAPAAICRKVAKAAETGSDTIEIWGDGRQVRSYLDVEDCVRGTIALMESDYPHPMNIGSDRAVTVDQLTSIVADIAGVELNVVYDSTGAKGVDARNADIRLARDEINWHPQFSLEHGLAHLYRWISAQVKKSDASDAHTSAQESTNEVPLAPRH